jgi:hypothetical protein
MQASKDMSPYAIMGLIQQLLHDLVQRPEMRQGDRARVVRINLDVAELRRAYCPKPPRVPLGQRYRMLAGAPEQEQDELLGRAG